MGNSFHVPSPTALPSAPKMNNEFPPLPILRRSPTEVRGRGHGPGRRPRFSADPSPVRCFLPLGSPVGISGWTLGGTRQGGLIKPGCLICHPYFPPVRPTDVPLRLPRVAPGKPRGPWNVPTTVVRVSLRKLGAPLGSPGGPLGQHKGALLGMSSGLLPRMGSCILTTKAGPQAIAPPQGSGWRYRIAPGAGFKGRFGGYVWGLFRVGKLSLFNISGPRAIAPPHGSGWCCRVVSATVRGVLYSAMG